MKNLLLFLSIFFFQVQLFAQEVHQQITPYIAEDNEVPMQRTCASADHLQWMESNDPSMKINRHLIEQHTQQFISHPTANKNRSVIKIPVVVHVIYNLNSQNISEAQINSQIDILNKDFRKLNIEIPAIPGSFGNIAADCEIEFALAHTDPNGDSTTGITRTYTATTTFPANNNMKYTATGGHDAWPRDQYLNIWVCKLSGGLLGYAQFPGGAAATDGVVVSYKAFGSTGTATSPYNKGRTATHEIGHWLNNFHIWGDDAGSCAGSDLVNDTPNQGAENYGCPTFPKFSCSGSADGDMFMNYMDYTNDACMSMFTEGQKQRMQSLFAPGGARESIANSTAYQYPQTASTLACGVPSNLIASNVSGESATISWDAVNDATAYTVTYFVPQYNNALTLTVSTNAVQLTGLYSTTPYHVDVQAVCAYGTSVAGTIDFLTTDPMVYFRCANGNAEPNDAITDAILVKGDAALESTILHSNDKDFYEIATTSDRPNFRITLNNLPMDYDIKVYNSNRELIATSQNLGTATEEIVYNTSNADRYFVEVYGYNGNYAEANCYNLASQTSHQQYAMQLNSEIYTKPDIYFYPNPAIDHIYIELNADSEKEVVYNIYNALGQLVETQKYTTHAGQNKVHVDIAKLPEGMYMLEYRSDIDKKVQKLNIHK